MIESLEKECWSLDMALAGHILPRLLYFKHWAERQGVPVEFEDDPEEWELVLDEMIWTFSYISQGYPSNATLYLSDQPLLTEEDLDTFVINYLDKEAFDKELLKDRRNTARAQRGLELFAEYYMDLWN